MYLSMCEKNSDKIKIRLQHHRFSLFPTLSSESIVNRVRFFCIDLERYEDNNKLLAHLTFILVWRVDKQRLNQLQKKIQVRFTYKSFLFFINHIKCMDVIIEQRIILPTTKKYKNQFLEERYLGKNNWWKDIEIKIGKEKCVDYKVVKFMRVPLRSMYNFILKYLILYYKRVRIQMSLTKSVFPTCRRRVD